MLVAKFTKPQCGTSYDIERCCSLLKVGKYYEVEWINMGQSHTSVYLKDFPKEYFNSVNFTFYEDGEEINIYKNPKHNPYL